MTHDENRFPRLFEALYADFVADLPLWLSLAKEKGGPVLELGCGPGRVLLALAQAGIEVHGLDRNPAMLARATHNLSAEISKRASLHQADLRSFNLGLSFNLVISPCNTFAYLDDQEIASALLCIRGHLTPGGLLALDLPNPATAVEAEHDPEAPLAAYLEPESGNPVQVYALQEAGPRSDVIHVRWVYDELLPDGRTCRLEVPEEYHLRSPDTLHALLEDSGYRDIRMLGDYDRSPFRADSPQMILLAAAP